MVGECSHHCANPALYQKDSFYVTFSCRSTKANETKTRSDTDSVKQLFQTVTLMKGTTRTANDTETVHTASKTVPSTSGNTLKARNTVKARFGIQMAHVTRVAGLRIVEMATAFTPTQTGTCTMETGTNTSVMDKVFTRTRQLGPNTRDHGYTGNGTEWES